MSGLEATNIQEIPPYCFAGCSSLKWVVGSDGEGLPATIVRIGDYAFYGCTSIESIKVERWTSDGYITYLLDTDDDPTVFPYTTLNDNPNFYISVPDEEAAAKYAEYWCTANRLASAKLNPQPPSSEEP